MSVFYEVFWAAFLVSSLACATVLVRRRRYRLSQVISAPAAVPVRLSLAVAVGGLEGLTGAWPLLLVQSAIIAWELTVQTTALVRRRARRSAHG